MEMIWQSVGGFIAIYGFAVVLGVPKNMLVWCGMNGAIGWLVYVLAEERLNNVLLSTFIAAIVISTCANICARVFKKPISIFLISANMTLVPGAGMYRIVYNVLQSDTEMATHYFFQTLQIAGVIAIAMFVVNSIWSSIISIRKLKHMTGKQKNEQCQ